MCHKLEALRNLRKVILPNFLSRRGVFYLWRFLTFVSIVVGYFWIGYLFNLSPSTDNLLPNPSFETGLIVPDGWATLTQGFGCNYTTTPPSLTYDWDSTQAHSGTRSVALKNISWPTGTTFTPGGWVFSDFISVVPYPQEYAVSVWALGASSNINLRPILFVCQYDETGNVVRSDAFSSLSLPGTSWIPISIKVTAHSSLSKIKLGLGVKCSSSASCSGSLWFDDVALRMIGKITVHKFEDVNRNRQQDVGEQNLSGWRINLFRGSGCNGDFISSASTDTNGNRTFDPAFSPLPLGEYSVSEILQDGWINTTPICQNVSLVAGQTPQVNFGNVQSTQPIVPYFSQTDSAWGSQEYDHASLLDLWCGGTIAQCGCTVTSAAMILKYYGVGRSPTGEPTDPGTLNNWLKNRTDGYINGDINWQAVTKYAKNAHTAFGTPKIDYLGRIDGQDTDTLNNELSLKRPVILQESINSRMHFLVATGISGSTYTINDPVSVNNRTLEVYGDGFQGMRRYSLTNSDLSAIILSIPSPGSILLIDSQNRKLGKDPNTGEVFDEIPEANFYLQSPVTDDTSGNPLIPPEGSGNFYIEVLDPVADQYKIIANSDNLNATLLAYDKDANVTGGIFNVRELQEYKLDYSPDVGSNNEISRVVNVDIKPGSNPNSINLRSVGVIPVAILTTPGFDATQVDPSSVRFGPNQAKETHDKGHLEDVDGDGDTDLVLHFKTQEVGTQNTDTQICLTGTTSNGVAFEGCDSIQIVSK